MPQYRLSLKVPLAALEIVEAGLAPLMEQGSGALSYGLPDDEGWLGLELYLETAPPAPQLAWTLALIGAATGLDPAEARLEALPAVDWVAESQKALPAIRAGRFYLYGSHVRERPPPAYSPLLVEAGAAFGTGRHETTRGCLVALTQLAKRRAVRKVLDMGCGSGLLAMAAARLWPCRVLAVDNDPVAVRVARANAALNRLSGPFRTAVSDGYQAHLVRRAGPYDLICANILAPPLRAMAPALARSLAPGGQAILSGLLVSQEAWVLRAHLDQGLRLQSRVVLGDWTTLVLTRRGPKTGTKNGGSG